MKLLLKLSLAILLVTSAFAAMTPEEFIKDSRVKSLAPNLVDEMTAQGLRSYGDKSQDLPPQIVTGLQLPLLNDIVKVISLNIFNGKDADWSGLEQAKVKATQEYGPDAMAAAVNLTEIDTRRAALIMDAVYDTVINLSPPSRDFFKSTAKMESEHDEEKDDQSTDPKKDEKSNNNNNNKASSSMWDILSAGLIKSSNTIKTVKGVIVPLNACETTDTAYLKGVNDLVYYSSLTHGFAGDALISAPDNSVVKSSDLQIIVGAIGKLAIEIHMAQNVARLADLNPTEIPVRTMVYLALTSESSTFHSVQMAREIHNLLDQGVGAGDIPTAVLRSLREQASFQIVTQSARDGLGTGPRILNSIPFVRNLFAFSTEVLKANNLGDLVKYVFCPKDSSSSLAEEMVKNVKEGVKEAGEKGSEAAQKVFKVGKEAVKNAVEEAKKKGQEVKENMKEEVKNVKDETVAKGSEAGANIKNKASEAGANIKNKASEAGANIKNKGSEEGANIKNKASEEGANIKNKGFEAGANIKRQASDFGDKVQEKVTEGTEKVSDAGEKVVQEAKDAAGEGKKKVEEGIDATKKKAEEAIDTSKKKAAEEQKEAKKKAEELEAAGKKKAEEMGEAAKKKIKQGEEVKQEL
ncbi:hypothetical protein BGZ65_003146 [Modicella reniformis]|uniref:Uncharacterized protein n=1 Tax=Modicella reniformis TaxID=1440133 RepID=A0A9P6IP45_9FUNG|nr:hypothetical protein BGZ65_003146 [Modicella reniformis]